MRIYSNVITERDLFDTAEQVQGIYIENVEIITAPRVRGNGYIVKTAGNTNRYRNSGNVGADTSFKAASWDDHGKWFNLLYAIDPNARITCYDNAEDFHKRTNGKYRTSEPQTLATHGVYIENN